MQRSEHEPGDLADSWYDLPNEDVPGWRGPAQIVIANDAGGHVTVIFPGKVSNRRHQEVRAHVPYLG